MFEYKLDDKGLLTAVIQDVDTGEVLMVAFMDPKSVERTLKEGKTVFYSRSRQKYWVKGESSGHIQEVKEILTDCDRDAIVIKVRQHGGACHLGYRTCFVHQLDSNGDIAKVTQEKVFDPDQVYSSSKSEKTKSE